MKVSSLGSLILAAGAVLVSASAQATSTPITACGTVITQPGHYELANSLLCVNDATKPAITVKNTKHVTIHMKGRSIAFLLKKLPIRIFPPKFEEPKAIGILASQSKDVEVKGDKNLSSIARAAVGVMARNSEDVKVEDLTLKNSKVGVSFQGSQSQDGEVQDAVFSQNACDIQTKLGAESPDVDDSNAGSFCS
jgi:hypothetical protein